MATKLLITNYNQNIHKHLNWLPGTPGYLTFYKNTDKIIKLNKPELATRLPAYPFIKTYTNTTTGYMDTCLLYHFNNY